MTRDELRRALAESLEDEGPRRVGPPTLEVPLPAPCGPLCPFAACPGCQYAGGAR